MFRRIQEEVYGQRLIACDPSADPELRALRRKLLGAAAEAARNRQKRLRGGALKTRIPGGANTPTLIEVPVGAMPRPVGIHHAAAGLAGKLSAGLL